MSLGDLVRKKVQEKLCNLPSDEFPEDQRGDAWEPPMDRLDAPAVNTNPVDGPVKPHDTPQPVLVPLASVNPQPVEWLWPGWILRGAVNQLDGDPGLGKSTLTLDLAARVSRGWPMPPWRANHEHAGGQPAGVLLLSAEDDLARTIRPRLDAAGADVERIHALESIKTGNEVRPPVLPWDLEQMERSILDNGIALVVIDPFLAYLDGGINSHRDQDIRRCEYRLKLLADRTRAAIVLVRHLNKMDGSPALYRGGGSIAIIAAARSALIVGRDPANPETCVLAMNKCNLAPHPKSLTYSLESVGDVARIAWGPETALTANDILAHPSGVAKQKVGQQCAALVAGLLANSPMPADELESRCKQAGFSERAIKEARQLLKVKVTKGSFQGKSILSLPVPGSGDDQPDFG